MKNKHLASGKGQVSKNVGQEVAANQETLGDLIWVRLNGGSWWPAQVVDENTVSASVKPRNRSAGKVLVRVYGSYKYLYVDPVKCHSEFEIILKQNNGSRRKIFEKAIEQDRPRSKSGRLKGQGAKSKENVKIDASRDQNSNQNRFEDRVIEASNYVRVSPRKKPHSVAPKIKVKNGNSIKAKSESFKQDGTKKNLKPNSRGSEEEEEEAESVTFKQSAEKDSENRTPKQDKVLKKRKLNTIDETTLFGKSQELSARRIKVMQSLGLIAPSGSPFHKNGQSDPL